MGATTFLPNEILPNRGISSTGLEGLHIVLGQVLRRHLGVKVVSIMHLPVLQVIGDEVLAGGHDFLDGRVVSTLKPIDQRSNIRLEVERILSGGFLTPAPSWISTKPPSVTASTLRRSCLFSHDSLVGIDVGCPVVQATSVGIVECSRLCADDRGNRMDQCVVKCGSHGYGLRERGCMGEVARSTEVDTGRAGHAM